LAGDGPGDPNTTACKRDEVLLVDGSERREMFAQHDAQLRPRLGRGLLVEVGGAALAQETVYR
jgi:hypothetical protein